MSDERWWRRREELEEEEKGGGGCEHRVQYEARDGRTGQGTGDGFLVAARVWSGC